MSVVGRGRPFTIDIRSIDRTTGSSPGSYTVQLQNLPFFDDGPRAPKFYKLFLQSIFFNYNSSYKALSTTSGYIQLVTNFTTPYTVRTSQTYATFLLGLNTVNQIDQSSKPLLPIVITNNIHSQLAISILNDQNTVDTTASEHRIQFLAEPIWDDE